MTATAVLERTCTEAGCDRVTVRHDLCRQHYAAERTVCAQPGCEQPRAGTYRRRCAEHDEARACAGGCGTVLTGTDNRCRPCEYAARKATAPSCANGDGRPVDCRGLCASCYQAQRLEQRGPCAEPGCDRRQRARGLCRRHYDAWRAVNAPRCSAPGCDRFRDAFGLCNEHRRAEVLEGVECSLAGCTSPASRTGLCAVHYVRPKYAGQTCAFDGCDGQVHSGVWCRHHGIAPFRYRTSVLEAHASLCGLCGEAIDDELHVDHVVPRNRGGSHDPRNLQPAHAWCNIVKGDRLARWRCLACGELVTPEATATVPAGELEGLVPVHVGCGGAS